jgi:hypothetical protein
MVGHRVIFSTANALKLAIHSMVNVVAVDFQDICIVRIKIKIYGFFAIAIESNVT